MSFFDTMLPSEAAAENATVPGLFGPSRSEAANEATVATQPAVSQSESAGLIVEDSTADLQPGQMRKNEFLDQLDEEVRRIVDAAIAGTGRTSGGCPYVRYWLDFYRGKDSNHIERSILRYAPETFRAANASEYILAVVNRAGTAAQRWANTGEITGVPEKIPLTLPSQSGPVKQIDNDTDQVQFKARDGGIRDVHSMRLIQNRLGRGRPLAGNIRSRMEPVFGMDFSNVRTYTDGNAAELSSKMNARAFTIGNQIAFGSGEYSPGTITGDAIIAHELAHVAQQSGGDRSFAPLKEGDSQYDNLEQDADNAAAGVLSSLWSSANDSVGNTAKHVLPRLRSGLRLQRCDDKTEDKQKEPENKPTEQPTELPESKEPQQPQEPLEAPTPQTEEETKETSPPLEPSGTNRLVVDYSSGSCIATSGEGAARVSSESFNVQYENTKGNDAKITLHDREDSNKTLHTEDVSANSIGDVTIPPGKSIANESHHFELDLTVFNSKGVAYANLQPKVPVLFQVAKLLTAPTGDNLLFAKMLYAEGSDAGEFPVVRDLVYNRIDWVNNSCPGDKDDFGNSINSALNAENQFDSVLSNTSKFQQLENELNTRSGECQYTTPPRSGNPNICRLINSAIETVNNGDGNSHEYVFFRSDKKTPSTRAVDPPWHYDGGNYYWKISECPKDRQKKE